MEEVIIRQEEEKDRKAVLSLIEAAFADMEFSSHNEHELVERLHASADFIPQLSIVAVTGDVVVGYVLLSKVQISNPSSAHVSLALAPLAVLPEYQRKGIGAKLMEAAEQAATEQGFTSVILLGHKDYYHKFDYKPCAEYGIRFPFEAPEEYCMAKELKANALEGVSGNVVYPKEFTE